MPPRSTKKNNIIWELKLNLIIFEKTIVAVITTTAFCDSKRSRIWFVKSTRFFSRPPADSFLVASRLSPTRVIDPASTIHHATFSLLQRTHSTPRPTPYLQNHVPNINPWPVIECYNPVGDRQVAVDSRERKNKREGARRDLVASTRILQLLSSSRRISARIFFVSISRGIRSFISFCSSCRIFQIFFPFVFRLRWPKFFKAVIFSFFFFSKFIWASFSSFRFYHFVREVEIRLLL